MLRLLARHEVGHVVVGGVAAVIEGAIVSTMDLDVVYAPDAANLERLQRALKEVGARYKDPAGREIQTTPERLRDNRMNLLRTSLGDLDMMQRIAPGWSYEEVFSRSKEVPIAELQVRVLDLAAVIESKTAAGRPKDIAVMPVLRNTLEMREQRRARQRSDEPER